MTRRIPRLCQKPDMYTRTHSWDDYRLYETDNGQLLNLSTCRKCGLTKEMKTR